MQSSSSKLILQLCFLLIPRKNLCILYKLICYLAELASKSTLIDKTSAEEGNLMSAMNLAIVFAPNIFDIEDVQKIYGTKLMASILSSLIEHLNLFYVN